MVVSLDATYVVTLDYITIFGARILLLTQPIAMPPLPQANDPRVQQLGNQHLSAYDVCLDYEQAFAAKLNQQRNVRTLGYLLLLCPEDVATGVRAEVSESIHSCKNKEDVAALGASFELYLIKPRELSVCHPRFLHPTYLWNIYLVLKFKGRTPPPSDHPSRSSFDIDKQRMIVDVTEAPKDHKAAKLQASHFRNFIPRPSFLLLALRRRSYETIIDVS